MQRGTHYHIIISQAWTDTRGKSLAKPYQKAFVTVAKDSLSPQPSQWALIPPISATKQALKIDFKEPLDHSLLQEVFSIEDNNGTKLPGQWEIDKSEQQCSFIPSSNWKTGSYKLLIQPRLEDLAGNNLVRPFDRDITQKSQPAPTKIIELSFKIR